MAARLEADKQGRAFRPVPRLLESDYLGMGRAYPVMGSFADDISRLVDDHGANPRIGVCSVWCGELDGSSHVVGIAHSVARH